MERVYKSMMGYKEADEKHGSTHVILSEDEYCMLVDERNDALIKASRIESSAKKQLADMKQQSLKIIYDDQLEAEDVKNELTRQIDLNRNLLRISKERANATRGLKPKKEHAGYIVLVSQQFKYTNRASRYNNNEYIFWKTVVQTPYDASMPIKLVQPMIEVDLINNFGAELGIQQYSESIGDILNGLNYEYNEEQNMLFSRRYKANYREGFWEVEYLHTSAITVPVNMRQPNYTNRNKNNSKTTDSLLKENI